MRPRLATSKKGCAIVLKPSERRDLCKQFPEDVARMRTCLNALGLQATDDDVVIAWRNYSDRVCACWLALPQDDADLQSILMKNLPSSIWSWQVTIQDAGDGSGYQILRVPPDLSERMGWKVGDTLNITRAEDEDLTLRRAN